MTGVAAEKLLLWRQRLRFALATAATSLVAALCVSTLLPSGFPRAALSAIGFTAFSAAYAAILVCVVRLMWLVAGSPVAGVFAVVLALGAAITGVMLLTMALLVDREIGLILAWRPEDEARPACHACGYDLAGLAPGPCPECGKPFTRRPDALA